MKMKFRKCTAMTVLFGIGAFAIAGTASAQSNCAWYALNSAKQQQANLQKSCGFKGDEWSKNVKAHKTWCESVPPQVWQATMDKRQKALNSCK